MLVLILVSGSPAPCSHDLMDAVASFRDGVSDVERYQGFSAESSVTAVWTGLSLGFGTVNRCFDGCCSCAALDARDREGSTKDSGLALVHLTLADPSSISSNRIARDGDVGQFDFAW